MALWDQTIAKKSKLVTDRSLSKADRYSRANQRRPFVRTNHKVSLADRPLTAKIGIVHLTDRLRLQMALNGSTVDIPGQGWVAISTTGLTQNHPQLTAQLRV
jgi:hypothetical protein